MIYFFFNYAQKESNYLVRLSPQILWPGQRAEVQCSHLQLVSLSPLANKITLFYQEAGIGASALKPATVDIAFSSHQLYCTWPTDHQTLEILLSVL